MNLLFFDIESSGLGSGSFPVELAWVNEDGQGEAHLVRPAAGWTTWSPKAEVLHGLSRETLLTQGRPASEIAARFSQASQGCRLVSDAPDWDGEWLLKLKAAAGLTGTFETQSLAAALNQACEPLLGLPEPMVDIEALRSTILRDARCRAERLRSGRHRAMPDALVHWQTWQLVGESVGQAMCARS